MNLEDNELLKTALDIAREKTVADFKIATEGVLKAKLR